MAISDLVAVVAQVRCFRNGTPIGSASSFFYILDEELFLITNRHVVIDESRDYYPDEIRLLLHTDPDDVRQNAEHSIPLYTSRSEPVWLEHPTGDSEVDVVAIPINRGEVEGRFVIRALDPSTHVPSNVDISIGHDVQVIGYPLGFHDSVHNLPIVRNATIASVYPVPFQGRPYILIDSRLHRGTSGSPVMTKPSTIISYRDGSTGMSNTPVTFFVGVHSASLDLVDRDPDVDEPLGLNVVWFASLIAEIIRRYRDV